MDKQIALAALGFLERCQLKGAEAPVFMAVVGALTRFAQPEVPPVRAAEDPKPEA